MVEEDILKELSEKGLCNIVNSPEKNTSLINSRYTLGKKIGEGGLSVVYEASDIYCQYFKDDRDIVIKIPSAELSSKKDISAFIYSEYSILIGLNHENIVKALDFGIDENRHLPYIVMEKLEGDLLINVSLHSITKQMKLKLAMSLYKALQYIHAKGIVHADINPTNIMISADGHARIFDFGISQSTGTKKSFSLSHDKTNAYNPIYSAPEIFEGKAPSKKSDLFSLACVLYELYTNELPYKRSSVELKENPLTRTQLLKIPLLQRAWFKKALHFDSASRTDKMPFCIRSKYFLENISWVIR